MDKIVTDIYLKDLPEFPKKYKFDRDSDGVEIVITEHEIREHARNQTLDEVGTINLRPILERISEEEGYVKVEGDNVDGQILKEKDERICELEKLRNIERGAWEECKKYQDRACELQKENAELKSKLTALREELVGMKKG